VEKNKFVVGRLCSSVSQIFISDTSVQILVKRNIKDLMSLVCVCVCVCGCVCVCALLCKTTVEFSRFSVKGLVKQEICTLYKMQTSPRSIGFVQNIFSNYGECLRKRKKNNSSLWDL
jgi:hypothetical protein